MWIPPKKLNLEEHLIYDPEDGKTSVNNYLKISLNSMLTLQLPEKEDYYGFDWWRSLGSHLKKDKCQTTIFPF